MKKKTLNILAAITLLLSIVLPMELSATTQNQTPKVVVGTYVSTIDGRIRIKGEDGNVYVLEVKNIDSTIAVSQGYGEAKVEKYVGLAELKEGMTVVINLQGVVFVDIKKK